MYKLNYYVILNNKSKKLIFETKDYTGYIHVKDILKEYPILDEKNRLLKFYFRIYVPNYSFLLDNLYLPLEIISEIKSYCTSNYEYRSKTITNYYELCPSEYFINYYAGYYILHKLSEDTYSMQMKCTNFRLNPVFKEIAKFQFVNLNFFELSIYNLFITLKNILFLLILNSIHFLLLTLYTLFEKNFTITLIRTIAIILLAFYIADFHTNQY